MLLSTLLVCKEQLMVKAHTLASIALALGLLATQAPRLGYAQETARAETTPIQIQRLGITQTAGRASRAWVALWFRNESTITADEIRVVLRYNGSESVIVDKGTFSPGVIIAHEFVAPADIQRFRKTAEATVRYVKYVDGTHWGMP